MSRSSTRGTSSYCCRSTGMTLMRVSLLVLSQIVFFFPISTSSFSACSSGNRNHQHRIHSRQLGSLSKSSQNPSPTKSLCLLFAANGDFNNNNDPILNQILADEQEKMDRDMAYRIMFNQQSRRRESTHYQIIAAKETEAMAKEMEKSYPDRFTFHPTQWEKFPDGTDKIEIGGFYPHNLLSGEHVLFLASFHNNDVTLSQFQVMICLLQSFIESLTIVLPFSPVGTMERVVREGQVATANTYAHMFSSLPNCGRPTRLMVYDLHTLQNRFYLNGNAVASLHTAIPLLKQKILQGQQQQQSDDSSSSSSKKKVDCIAFPDDGAAKRFGAYFEDMGLPVIVCGKTRGDGDTRTVVIQDGNAAGKHIVIVDDLVQTGGTLYETGKVLKEAGAASVHAFCSHAVFPKQSWKRFNVGGDRACFETFWVTNSIPTVTDALPVEEGIFEVLDLMDLIIHDLDHYGSSATMSNPQFLSSPMSPGKKKRTQA
mmetsp:Transcript_20087/g.46778  ORF Transcript_20087/g.46778 Transcript_20087/m.46778 type:complete len:484 (-) Transcript_20087:78-1529(-)